MGAWGIDALDNDTAADWALGLEGADGLFLVREALDHVDEVGEEYLDSDVACEALAAGEVIARLKGNWGVRNPYTEPIDLWVEAHQGLSPGTTSVAAVAAIDRILQPPSELLELWQETDDFDAWHRSVLELKSRIRA